MDRYAVLGNPIEHSRSPQIHRLFAEQTGEEIAYDALLVPRARFVATVRELVAAGARGFNVTLPFKGEACESVDWRSEEAERAGAVNTVVVAADGVLNGYNTDGQGLLHDLVDNLGWTVAGKCVLLIGAGGAVAGILPALLEAGPARILIANRSPRKAELLADRFDAPGILAAAPLGRIPEAFDLVINGTSASLQGDVPRLDENAVDAHTRCYDLVYGPGITAFNRWAAMRGAAATSDGLGMLVEQAARSFELWRDKRPLTRPVIERLRAELSQQRGELLGHKPSA